MIRLSVDTSFENLSLCITKNDLPLGDFFSSNNRQNSKIIFNIIDNLLKNAGIKLAEIDAYVINCGPGSYTGVRIGMSVVKTFAQVYKKPVIPVNSLELLAKLNKKNNLDFNVLLNCTSREIFFAKFKTFDNQPVIKSPIYLTNLEKFLKTSNDIPVVLYRVNPERRNPEPMFDSLNKIEIEIPKPDAILLDTIGSRKYRQKSFNYNFQVNPLYIKREI